MTYRVLLIGVGISFSMLDVEKTQGQWWRKPLMPTLGRQKKVDFCEFQAASLVYRARSKIARAT